MEEEDEKNKELMWLEFLELCTPLEGWLATR